MRAKIFSEHRLASVRQTIVFAFLGLFLWGADWSIDADHALKALLFRGAFAAVLLASALVKWWSKSLYVNFFAAYVSLALCEGGMIKLLEGLNGGLVQLHGGLDQGAGQLLYIFIGILLFCPAFPSTFNFAGCVALTLLPHAVGEILDASFPHVLYAATLWPASALTMLILWRHRMLLVEKHKLNKEIETAVVTDPITGLPNVRGLMKAFQRLGKLHKIKPMQQILLLIEIDGVDGIRASHGQVFANALLAKMGEIIELTFRGRDITAFVGENQFACILPDSTREKGIEIAERLRAVIEETSINCPTAETGKLNCTVSIGIAPFDVKDDIKTLLNRARIGVEQAKSRGGNRSELI